MGDEHAAPDLNLARCSRPAAALQVLSVLGPAIHDTRRMA